jgi:GAF domain-containing protein/CheY-like chemotaxis protein
VELASSFAATAFDSLDQAVFLTDEQFRVLVWNDAMARRTGLARAAVLGLPAPAILDVLGGDCEARLATWRTDEGVIGGVTVSLKAEGSPRRDDRFLRVIETIGKSLSGASNVSDVLDTVVSTAMQVMRADSAMVVGWDGRAPDLDILRVVGRLGVSYAPGGTLPVTSGPMSRAAREARTIVTRDILADPRMHVGPERAERIARAGFKGVMAAPMIVKGTVHGALGVYYWSERTFGEDEIAVLTLLGQHAALVIDHARAHAEATRRAARLRGLADVEELVSGSLDLDDVLRRITQATARLVDAPVVQVWTADPQARVLRRRAATVESEEIEAAMLDVLPFGEGVSGRAAELRAPIWVPDLRLDPAASTVLRWAIDIGLARVLAVPILSGDDLLGMLTIFGRRAWVWSDEERALVTSIAARAAVALQNARVYTLAVQHAARMRALVAVGQSITASLDAHDVMRRISVAAAGMRTGATAALHEVDTDAGVLRLVASAGPHAAGMPEEIPLGKGLPRLVTERRAPVLVEHPADRPDSAVPDWWRAHPRASYYGLPIIVADDDFVGVLTYIVADSVPDGEEQEALRVLAAYAGIAIRNASRYQSERSQAERIRALATVNRRISSALDLDELLGMIAASAVRLTGVRYVFFWLADERRRTLALGASSAGEVMEAYAQRRLGYDEGAAGWVARHRVPLALDDVFTDDRVIGREWWRRGGLRSLLSLPVMSGDRLLAVLALAHTTPIRLTPDTRDVMDLFIAQAAIAIENARLYRDAERRRDVAEGLARLGRELTATLDLDWLGAVASRGVLGLLHAGEAAVYLHEPDDGGPRRIGAQPDEGRVLVDEIGESVAILAVTARASVVARDVLDDHGLRLSEAARARLQTHPHRAIAAVPLLTRERVIGSLVVAGPAAGEFAPEEIQTLQTAADRVALAIDNARLYAETERERREAAALAGAARRLALYLDFEQVAAELVETLLDLFQAHGSGFYRLREDGALEAVAFAGTMRAHMERGYLMPRGAGLVGRTVTERGPAWSHDLLVDPRVDLPGDVRTTIERSGNRGVLAVPLMAKNDVIGSLVISYPTPRSFARREIALLQAFADTAALALENARLYASVRDNLGRLRDTQTQLLQAAKMSALGQLVSGVAHELNNPLSVIIGYSQLLLAREVPAPLRRPVELMASQADRMAKIVKNLLLFARQRAPERGDVNINDVIEQTLTLRQNQLKLSGITVERDLAGGLPPVAGDAQQLQQVVLNLLLNAEQAILDARRGSRIVVRTRPSADGRRVVTQVVDDGPGISPDTLPRVFEPFFTTKEVGVGTGLGLSVSYGIVEEHGGRLSVESRPGVTVFTMELLVASPATAAVAPPVIGVAPRMEGRVALVVEDEPAVQDMVVALLRESGWSVDVAAGGRAALEQLRQRRYHLIVSDIRMPEGSGEELYREAVATDPDLGRRFLFVSGDTANPEAWSFLHDVAAPAIEKPFPPAQFLEIVRRVAAPLTTPP